MENKEIKQAIGTISADEIQRLKAQNGRVYEITATDDGETHVAYFRRPDMQTLAAMTKIAKTDEIKASQILMEGCFLAGSELMKKDTALFVATVAQLSKVVASVRATLKNV